MNSENERFVSEAKPEWSPVRWAFDIWMWLFIVVAVLVFELFADPLLAGLVICLKLGWSDLRASIRIGKDPFTQRGAVLSGYYGARACLKVALSGSVIAIGIVAGVLLLPMNIRPEPFVLGIVLMYVGFFLAMIVTLGAALSTIKSGVRPWVSKSKYVQRPYYPPSHFGTHNHVRGILVGGMVATSVIILPYAIVFLRAVVLERVPSPLGVLLFAVVFLLIWAAIVWQMYRALRFAAKEPQQCWPELDSSKGGPSSSHGTAR